MDANERYGPGDDGLVVEKVGIWSKRKLKILTDYVQASSATRRKYLRTGAAYIDVFSGPGRSQIRETKEFIDGSPVAAFKQAGLSPAQFTSIEISDDDDEFLAAAEKRLELLRAPARTTPGPAIASIKAIISNVDPHGLHFAFLDPHNLGALSFSLFESLAKLKHVDVIAHVSISDLQRNADRYTSGSYGQFDSFAPGWRERVRTDVNQASFRAALLEYWTEKVSQLGLPRAMHCELISTPTNQRLYLLIFLSPSDFARKLWQKIRSEAKAPRMIE